jgi:hypothetical protein
MKNPRVYADFHNCDSQGRVRLNTVGTLEDLARQQVQLRDGLALALYADDANDLDQPDELRADGIVAYSEDERCWVAVIDWNAVHHASEEMVEPVGPPKP